MSTATKIWIITAASLLLLGCIIFVGVMSMIKWDFAKLSTSKYETNRYDIAEDFKGISIGTNTADVKLEASEDGTCFALCHERTNEKHAVKVENGTLIIELTDTRKWYEYIGFDFDKPEITLYLPRGEYGTLSVKADTGDIYIPKDFSFEGAEIKASTGDVTCNASIFGALKIKTSTGDIFTEELSAGSLDLAVTTGRITASDITCGDLSLKVSTGNTQLSDVICKSITSSGNTGNITIKNLLAAEKLSIKRSTGNVSFDGMDAAELFIETDTGDVVGSLLSDKVFIANTDTGTTEVPSSLAGGRCEITTNTGDIKITVKK